MVISAFKILNVFWTLLYPPTCLLQWVKYALLLASLNICSCVLFCFVPNQDALAIFPCPLKTYPSIQFQVLVLSLVSTLSTSSHNFSNHQVTTALASVPHILILSDTVVVILIQNVEHMSCTVFWCVCVICSIRIRAV
jgi:hypothetical protein